MEDQITADEACVIAIRTFGFGREWVEENRKLYEYVTLSKEGEVTTTLSSFQGIFFDNIVILPDFQTIGLVKNKHTKFDYTNETKKTQILS